MSAYEGKLQHLFPQGNVNKDYFSLLSILFYLAISGSSQCRNYFKLHEHIVTQKKEHFARTKTKRNKYPSHYPG